MTRKLTSSPRQNHARFLDLPMTALSYLVRRSRELLWVAAGALRGVLTRKRGCGGLARPSSSYFLVLGQISRHGWRFTVSLACCKLRPIAENCGPRSLTVRFRFCDAVRKFRRVASMSLFCVRSRVNFSSLSNAFARELSGAVNACTLLTALSILPPS